MIVAKIFMCEKSEQFDLLLILSSLTTKQNAKKGPVVK